MKEGDSDDEIAELRIQALLTKRENEAEISPAHEPQSKPPPHLSLNQPLSNYRPGPHHYHQRPRPYPNYYNPPPSFQYNKVIRGQAINSSNIVVLTSSDSHSLNDHSRRKPGGNWGRVGNEMNKSISAAVQKTRAPQLILPQDANAKIAAPSVNDPSKTKLSARMRRLQGSGSDSEDSESDSSDESSSESSSSDSSTDSSSSDSDSDSDSSSDGPKSDKNKSVKESKLENVKETTNQLAPDKQTARNGKMNNDFDHVASQSVNKKDPAGMMNSIKHPPSPTRTLGSNKSLESSNKKRPLTPRRESHLVHSNSSGIIQQHKSRSSVSPSKHGYSPHRSCLSPRLRNSNYKRSLSKDLAKSPLRKKSPKRNSQTPPRSHLPRRYSKSPPRRYLSTSPQRQASKFPRYRSRSRSISKSPFSSRRYYRSRSPTSRQFVRDRSYSPLPPRKYSSKSPPPRKLSPLHHRKFSSKSPPPRMLSPLRRYGSPYRRYSSRSPPPRRYSSRSPPPRRYSSRSPPPRRYSSRSPLTRRLSRSPLRKKLSPNRRTPPLRVLSRSPPRKIGVRQMFSKSPVSRENSPLGAARRSRSPIHRRHGSWSPKRKNFNRSPYAPQSPIRKFPPHSPYRRSPSPLKNKKRSPLRGPFSPDIKREGSPSKRYEQPDSATSSLVTWPTRRSLSPHSRPAKSVKHSPARRYGSRSPYQQKIGISRSFSPIHSFKSNRSSSPQFIRGPNSHPTDVDPKANHSHPYQRNRSPYRSPFRRSNSPHPPMPNQPSSGNLRTLRHWSPHKGPFMTFPEESEQIANYPQKFENSNYGSRPPYLTALGNHSMRHPPPLIRHPPPHIRLPLVRPPATFPSNSHSLIHPPYMENRPPQMDRNWSSGPPSRNFNQRHLEVNRGGRGYPRMERYGEPFHAQHPPMRGRGMGVGPSGRGVHTRLGRRGPWPDGSGGPATQDQLNNDYYKEAPPHHKVPTNLRKDFAQEDRNYTETCDTFASQILSPQRRVPRGPRTPPYSPQREPSPLEWQKLRKFGKDRTPTLSPSPPKTSLIEGNKDSNHQKNLRKRSRSREVSKTYPQDALLGRDPISSDEKRPNSRLSYVDEYPGPRESKYKLRKKETLRDAPRHKIEAERELVPEPNKTHSHSLQTRSRERSKEHDMNKHRRDYPSEPKHRISSSERSRHSEKKPEKDRPRSPHIHGEKQAHSTRNRSPREERGNSPPKQERKEIVETKEQNYEKPKDRDASKGRKEEESSKNLAKHDKKKMNEENAEKKVHKSHEQGQEANAPVIPEKLPKGKKPIEDTKKVKEEEDKKKKKKRKKEDIKVRASKKKKKEKEKEKKKKKDTKKKKKHRSHEKLPVAQDENIRREKKGTTEVRGRSRETKPPREAPKRNADRSRSGARPGNDDRDAYREEGKRKRSDDKSDASWNSGKRENEERQQQQERRKIYREEREDNRQQKDEKVFKEERHWRRPQRNTFNEEFSKVNKGFVVTVGSGSNRQVTQGSARNLSKGREKSGDSPRVPVHMRLGPLESKDSKGGHDDDGSRRKDKEAGRSNQPLHVSSKSGHSRREMTSDRRARKTK